MLVVLAAATDTLRLGQRTQVALSGAYYDVYQRRSFDLPDFRSTAPSLRFDQGFAKSVLVSLGGGYRWFTFKPDDAYSFAAPTAFFVIRHALPGDVLAGGAVAIPCRIAVSRVGTTAHTRIACACSSI